MTGGKGAKGTSKDICALPEFAKAKTCLDKNCTPAESAKVYDLIGAKGCVKR
jgi:hypothetical protein